MTHLHKTIGSVAAALLLVGAAAGAHGFTGGGVLNQRLAGMRFRGRVVCTRCTLAQVRVAPPDQWSNHFYRITHGQEQAVLEVEWVSNPLQWSHLMTTPHLRLRGADSFFEQLTAEESRFKEIEVFGTLSSSQTLDTWQVTLLE